MSSGTNMLIYPPRHILVPVDFGEASARALTVAGVIATTHGASVIGLHSETLEVPPYFTHDQLSSVERHLADSRTEAGRYLAAFVHRAIPGAVTRLVDGPPVPAILAAAQSADLVVMGTHGRRGPSRWWLGSVAERIVRESRTPVIVVRAAASEPNPSRIFAHLVGVAASELDAHVRQYASTLAAAFGGRLDETTIRSREGLECQPTASLMVVGLGHGDGYARFGDVAERLVRSCTLPMLFVPTGE